MSGNRSQAEAAFLAASAAVWREIDRLSAQPGGYQGFPGESIALRHAERQAWERYRSSLEAKRRPDERIGPMGQYVIARSADAGVFAGELVAPVTELGDGTPLTSVTLAHARRLWYWAGAATLSQLAVSGTSKPADCKFPPEVTTIVVMGVCEVLAVTDAAWASIAEVPAWLA